MGVCVLHAGVTLGEAAAPGGMVSVTWPGYRQDQGRQCSLGITVS